MSEAELHRLVVGCFSADELEEVCVCVCERMCACVCLCCGTLLALSISWLFPSPTHVFTRVAHEGAVQSSSSADAVSPRGWCSLASSPRQVPEERFLAGLCGCPTCTNPAPQYAPARTFSLPPTSVGRFGVSERRIVHHPPWRDLWPFLLRPGPTRYECGRSELVPLSLHSGFAVSVLGGAHGVRVRAWGRSHAITDSELGGSFHMCMNHHLRLCHISPQIRILISDGREDSQLPLTVELLRRCGTQEGGGRAQGQVPHFDARAQGVRGVAGELEVASLHAYAALRSSATLFKPARKRSSEKADGKN